MSAQTPDRRGRNRLTMQRRLVLKAGVWTGLGVATVAAARDACAATGIDALDQPAIRLVRPAGVVLIALSKAGARLVAVGEQGTVIYSDNDGQSWTQAAVPVQVTLTCVQFATPKLGWAAGHFGVILHTTDGGETWTMQLNGLQAIALTIAAANAAVAQNSTAPGAPHAVARAEHFQEDGPDKPFLCLAVLSETKCIAFGALRMAMLTQDGGASWQDWSLHIGDALSHNIYAARVAGPAIMLAGEAGTVFSSVDNGETFAPLATPGPVTLFGIIAAPDGGLVSFGVAGNAFRSADKGQSWVPLSLPTQANLTASVMLQGGWLVIASEAGEAFASADNGKNFVPVKGLPQGSIFDVALGRQGTLVLAGASGVATVPLTSLAL